MGTASMTSRNTGWNGKFSRMRPCSLRRLGSPNCPNTKCRFPDEARPSRHLKSTQNPDLFAKAQSVCAGNENYDACLDDVMYT